ncbi:hypothetical protein [Streptomyces microflavus]|uniref:hypothetical protein n=1 Tax=Streptomyces microflavus TaxID=1919 RepID=UPI0033E133BD
MLDGKGDVTVTLRRLHFTCPTCELDVGLKALSAIDLLAADVFQASFINTQGRPATVRVHTLWVSLILVVAALAGFPAHPRLMRWGVTASGFRRAM